jgi:succinyl-diaminopimelate desuccinylase
MSRGSFMTTKRWRAAKNGLGLFGAAHPEWVQGDFAIVGEPSNAIVEGGCNGTLRVEVSATGRRAHSARSWKGDNAIHRAQEILDRLVSYNPPLDVDGLAYREGMNAVGISGGVAGNVIPDLCTVTVNYRFAPDKGVSEAIAHVRELFEGLRLSWWTKLLAPAPGSPIPWCRSLWTPSVSRLPPNTAGPMLRALVSGGYRHSIMARETHPSPMLMMNASRLPRLRPAIRV